MNQKGQGLVEALIALGAAVIIVAAITIAVVTSVNNTDYSKYQNLATNYARQGLEIVKQESQSDWVSTATYSGTLCLAQGAATLPPFPSSTSCQDINISNMFIRQVDIQNNIPPGPACVQGSPNVACCDNFNSPCCVVGPVANCADTPEKCSSQVAVTVKWTDGKCAANSYCHKVVLDSCLQNINQVK